MRSDLKKTDLIYSKRSPFLVSRRAASLRPPRPSRPRRNPGPGTGWQMEEHWEAIAHHAARLYFPNEG